MSTIIQKIRRYLKKRPARRAFIGTLTICIAILMLISCSQGADKVYIPFQSYPFAITAELEINGGRYTARISADSDSDMTISFLGDESMCGTELSFSDKGRYLCCGEVKIPLPAGEESGIFALPQLLRLCGDELSDVKVKDEENIVSFQTDNGRAVVVLSRDGSLRSIDATINGTSIKLTVISDDADI